MFPSRLSKERVEREHSCRPSKERVERENIKCLAKAEITRSRSQL